MNAESIVQELIRNEETLLIVVITGAVVVCSFFKAVTNIVTGLARERTRRDIAAYIAEGTMTPEQGERIINARHRS
jgi:hypothetical protein